mgnify:CR=1 FL=1
MTDLWDPETTPNFARYELACKCGTCGWRADMLQSTMDSLQALREALGRPLTITSGFRCPNHPIEKRKRSPGSHAVGRAVDIAAPAGSEKFEIVAEGIRLGLVGIGVSDGFIHIDTGHPSAPRPAAWTY